MPYLNYKYEIFPTKPQKAQIYRILRETRLQWNKAVNIRKKLKAALVSGQIEYIINTCLSTEKNDNQANRRYAIEKICSLYPNITFETAAHCYNVKNLIGKVLGDVSIETLLDVKSLSELLKAKHKEEVAKRKEAASQGIDRKKLPKLTVFWQLMDAINKYAGYTAKNYIDKSFQPPKGMSLATVRFNISGSANSHRWNKAVQPSKDQRAYGAKGEPQYKKRGQGFTFQIPQGANIFRKKQREHGYQIFVNPLSEQNRWINIALHRHIPEGSNIKQMTINERAGRFFAVLTCEVPDSAWKIKRTQTGWHAGIDPGASTALTVVFNNTETSETRQAAIHYQFLEKGLAKLEKIQQTLARKQGPRRKRTQDEINKELTEISAKQSIQKLSEQERIKEIDNKKKKLENITVRQNASNSWKKLSKKVSELHYKIANQRLDVLHKISRSLVETCDLIGIGHWEPERRVSYRNQRKELQKQVKAGIHGAKEKLKALEEEKTKQGPKGIKKIRRSGRDRSIATLRAMIQEKAKRGGTTIYPYIIEAGTTTTCSNCGAKTGPTGKKDLSVRQWICKECGSYHHRDLNSAINILTKTKQEFDAAQASALRETSRHTAARMMTHGTTGQFSSNVGFRVRGSSERGGSLFNQNTALPILLEKEAPKAFKSLITMGVVRSLNMQESVKNATESPP